MIDPKDDSGYNSNLGINHDIFSFENSIDVNDEVSHISDLVSKSHIDESAKNIKQIPTNSGIISSTPYGHLLIDEEFEARNQTIEVDTPKNRKRKKPSTFKFTDFDHTLDEFSSPSLTRQQLLKTKCTRKLWVDISDGSLSDTDLSSEKSSKKICLEGSRARSEPNSPQRNFSTQSPIKNLKLGSAETNEVLYPKICYKPKPKRYRISTPSQIRQRIKEKLLFENISDIRKPNQKLESFIRATSHVDFFKLFTVKSSNYHIIENILSNVEPRDLLSVYNVSKTARSCICKNVLFNNLRKNYQRQKRINKENLCSSSNSNSSQYHSRQVYDTSGCSETSACSFGGQLNHNTSTSTNTSTLVAAKCLKTNNTSHGKSTSNSNDLVISHSHSHRSLTLTGSSSKVSPRKREWLKFVEASADLTPGQKLTRCSRCSNPARVIRNVVICTRRGCQFVCCPLCCDPLCLSVLYLEKYSDTENIPTTPEFLNSIPVCSSSSQANDGSDMWLKKRDNRIFAGYLAECSNSKKQVDSLSSFCIDEEHILNNNNNNNNNTVNSSSFCSIFNLNISDQDQLLPKTVSDLIECKTNKLNKTIVNKDLLFVPESPPKVSRPSTISSKVSKKNLRRL